MRFGSLMAHGKPSSLQISPALLFLSTHGLLFLAAFFLTSSLSAQAQDRQSPRTGDGQHVVVISEKSPFLAGALEVVTLPTIGFAYAGNWKGGLPSAAVRIVGLVLWGEQLSPFGAPPCEAACVVGGLMLAGGVVWAARGAAGTATRVNDTRRAAALSAMVPPPVHGGGLGIPLEAIATVPRQAAQTDAAPARVRGAIWGAGIGLAAGGLLGGLTVQSDHGSDGLGGTLTESAAVGEAVVIGGLVGAAIGALLGASVFAPSPLQPGPAVREPTVAFSPFVSGRAIGLRARMNR